MKALHDINIHTVNGIERPCFVLAILKLAFLMGRKGLVKLRAIAPPIPWLRTA